MTMAYEYQAMTKSYQVDSELIGRIFVMIITAHAYYLIYELAF